MPIIALPRLLLSLVSLAILAGAVYLLWGWGHGQDVLGADGVWRRARGPDWRLYLGLALLAWSFLGRFGVLMLLPGGADEPREQRGEARTVEAPDGALLHVETTGPRDGPTLVLTHGWGLDATAWWYAWRDLAPRYRLVRWDLPGLGRSTAPPDGKFTLDRFAQALGAVVDSSGSGPVILIGHSIGGMATQTFFRACRDDLRNRVAGVVLLNTTDHNPLRTMWLNRLWTALRWPLIEPLCWLTIVLSPLAWLSAWQSYLSGSSHLAMRLTGFGRHATRGQVDLTARLSAKGSPAAQAKGNLAMFRWDVRKTLPTVSPPVLVLAGSRDIVTLPLASEAIAGALPRGQVLRMDGAGHMGFLERAKAYDQAILDFADQIFQAPQHAGPPAGVA